MPPAEWSIQGRVVVLTGGTSGIGQVTAETLAARGARIVLVARNRQRGEAALARLQRCGTGERHTVHYADLSSVAQTRRLGADIAAAEPRVDVLINNAGAIFSRWCVTAEGLELTFATNHMAYFVLTESLRSRLAAAAPSRVVNTASRAHHGASLDFDDLQSARRYSGLDAYRRSKLCNILYTRELARRLRGSGVTANALHPGFVATRFGDEAGGLASMTIRVLKRFALSPERGAETLVYLASAPELTDRTMGYYVQCRPGTPSAQAQDDDLARRLWNATLRLASVPS